MASLTPQLLEQFKQDYDKSDKYKLMTNAINKTAVADVLLNRDVAASLSHVFSHKVSNEGKPTTNQKSSGRCWLFAALNTMRIPFMEKHNIDSFEFSQNYLFFYDKLEKSNYFLDAIIKTREEPTDCRVVDWLLKELISDGGQWDMLVNLVEKYGVVPKAAYPETAQSVASRTLNRFLKGKLRDYACELRSMKGSVEELEKKKAEQMTEVYRILCIFLGPPPQKFDWCYYTKDKKYVAMRDITPQEFFKTHVPYKLDDQVCLINAPTADKPYNKLFTVQFLGNIVEGHKIRYINVTVEELKKYAIAQLSDGNPIWFGCDVGKHFNRKLGTMNMDLLDYKLGFDVEPTMTKAQRLDYRQSEMTHAMVLTAVNLVDGKPTQWRIENSWGSEGGDKGYLVMADNWFDEYLYELVIDKKYLPKETVEILSQEPIVLKPWDPMGSLAC